MAPDNLKISQLDAATQLDDLRPLWLSMRDHHHALTPDWGPVHGDDDSWARRRKDYANWLTEPDAFCLVARDEAGTAVGYALLTVNSGSPTWVEPGRFAYLESLSVAPDWRGKGVGKLLVDAVGAHLATIGVKTISVTAVSANAEALRFYEREGFSVSFITLTRD